MIYNRMAFLYTKNFRNIGILYTDIHCLPEFALRVWQTKITRNYDFSIFTESIRYIIEVSGLSYFLEFYFGRRSSQYSNMIII